MDPHPPTYCALDYLDDGGRYSGRGLGGKVWIRRQNERLGVLRDLAAAQADDPDSPIDPAIRELGDRRAYWMVQERHHGLGGPAGCLVAVVALVLIVAAHARAGRYTYLLYAYLVIHPWILAVFFGAVLVLAIPFEVAARRGHRIVARWQDEQCPTCEFDLSGTVDGVALEGVRVGPSACPECGAPWPLVPPPVPVLRGR